MDSNSMDNTSGKCVLTERQVWPFDLPNFWLSRSIPIMSAGSTCQLLTCIQIGPQDDWWNRTKQMTCLRSYHEFGGYNLHQFTRMKTGTTQRCKVISHLEQIHKTSSEVWRDWRPCAHAHAWQDQYSHLVYWSASLVQKQLKDANSFV